MRCMLGMLAGMDDQLALLAHYADQIDHYTRARDVLLVELRSREGRRPTWEQLAGALRLSRTGVIKLFKRVSGAAGSTPA
ncbi:Uncharacterised protein [Mycobacteroides abscessus subsp. abscessus]|nr:Uncharacterised protein [Mycobacteroides abscessus subsp. abscessus]